VETVTATPQKLPRTVSAVGSLASPQQTTIAAEVAGTLVALEVPEGRRVEAGQVLARLDDDTARAALAVARARIDNARDRLARIQPLHAQGVASQQALDDAKSEFEAATGAHDEAATRLAKHVIRAPFAGVVGLRQANVGQYVEAGDPIVEITPLHALELRFAVPQRHVGEVAVGQTVLGVVGRCEHRFQGVVSAVDPRVDPETRMVGLRAQVSGSDGALVPGMAVRVRLLVGEIPDAIVVPQEAVVRQGTKHYVFTVDGEGKVAQSEVALGEFFVDGVHLVSGVAPGALVVTAGHQKLRPGAVVQAQPHRGTHNPNVDVGRYGPADCT
jgi:membrane fusion protein (multidrug efflux system)